MADEPSQIPSSDSHFEKLRCQEYETLRAELNINRQFIFERPLLIVGVSFAALAGVNKDSILLLQGLILFSLLLLIFNLWFTFNRLSSNARILGYLRVVHEDTENVLRPGWENALSLQRTWLAQNAEAHKKIEEDCRKLKMHDANRFYGGLFCFHALTGGLALALGFLSLGPSAPPYSGLLLKISAAVYLFGNVVAFMSWSPNRTRNSLEVQTHVWRRILRHKTRGGPEPAPVR